MKKRKMPCKEVFTIQWRKGNQKCISRAQKCMFLGAVHKRRPKSGGRLSNADIFRTRGVLPIRASALFGAKNTEFFEIYGVSAWTRGRGLNQCGHFSDKGEGVNFSRFCADVFYGRPLIEL